MKTLLGFGIITITIAFLTGCGSSDVRTQQVKTEIVTNFETLYVTNTIFVTNPPITFIPDEYLNAKAFVDRMKQATVIGSDRVLFQMKDVNVKFKMDNALTSVVPEDMIKAKFELTLRRNGINISSESKNQLNVDVEGVLDDDKTLVAFNTECAVTDTQIVWRNGEPHTQTIGVWTRNIYGLVGKNNAEAGLLNDAEKLAELFANDFLSANPK